VSRRQKLVLIWGAKYFLPVKLIALPRRDYVALALFAAGKDHKNIEYV